MVYLEEGRREESALLQAVAELDRGIGGYTGRLDCRLCAVVKADYTVQYGSGESEAS